MSANGFIIFILYKVIDIVRDELELINCEGGDNRNASEMPPVQKRQKKSMLASLFEDENSRSPGQEKIVDEVERYINTDFQDVDEDLSVFWKLKAQISLKCPFLPKKFCHYPHHQQKMNVVLVDYITILPKLVKAYQIKRLMRYLPDIHFITIQFHYKFRSLLNA